MTLNLYEIEYQDGRARLAYIYAAESVEGAVRKYAEDCFLRDEICEAGEGEEVRVFEYVVPARPGEVEPTGNEARTFRITLGAEGQEDLGLTDLKVEEVT